MTEIRKTRASGAPGSCFQARRLSQDDRGTWLLVEPSTPHVHEDGWVVLVSPNPHLLLVPDSGNWVAATSHTDAKVDLCSRISVGVDNIEFVDVELDVVWRWGEPARLEDIDEFEALALPTDEAASYLREAVRIQAAVDAGRAPLGPSFRQRLVEVAGPPDPLLQSTWATAVGPLLADPVAAIVDREWIARQPAGAGWMLCGG
ncbi:MAG: DUF402 domain-containing protein, partial [Pseudonocardiaceae bacterium]